MFAFVRNVIFSQTLNSKHDFILRIQIKVFILFSEMLQARDDRFVFVWIRSVKEKEA